MSQGELGLDLSMRTEWPTSLYPRGAVPWRSQQATQNRQVYLLHTPNPGAKRYLAPGVTCPPGAGVAGLWKGKMS